VVDFQINFFKLDISIERRPVQVVHFPYEMSWRPGMVSPMQHDEGGKQDDTELGAEAGEPEGLRTVSPENGSVRCDSEPLVLRQEVSALDSVIESLIDNDALKSIRKSQHET
jgi:hypothetical protein